MVGDVGHHVGPVESLAVECHMFRGAEGVATGALPHLGWVVRLQAIDICACEGMVNGDLDGCGGSVACVSGQGRGYTIRVGEAFLACLPEWVVLLAIRGVGECVGVGKVAGEVAALSEGECGVVVHGPLVEGC